MWRVTGKPMKMAKSIFSNKIVLLYIFLTCAYFVLWWKKLQKQVRNNSRVLLLNISAFINKRDSFLRLQNKAK